MLIPPQLILLLHLFTACLSSLFASIICCILHVHCSFVTVSDLLCSTIIMNGNGLNKPPYFYFVLADSMFVSTIKKRAPPRKKRVDWTQEKALILEECAKPDQISPLGLWNKDG